MKIFRDNNFILLVVLVLPILLAIAVGSEHTHGAYQPKITGTWAEVWGTRGWESNVDYVDTLVVIVDQKGQFDMHCTNKPHYRYDHVDFDGNLFSFRMQNSSYSGSKFYVNYRMRFAENPDLLVGESKNSREDHNYVKMIRIK